MTDTSVSTSVEDKVAFLSSASAYPDYRGTVKVVETHLSWVFLTGGRAYKLKKPVHRQLQDFSTVESRHHNCLEEVRLNRRLGGDTYIGVEPLCRCGNGKLLLGTGGEVVDWLVVMHRLPATAMLSHQIESGAVDEQRLAQVVTRLTRFYIASQAEKLMPDRYLQILGETMDANELALADFSPSYATLHRQQTALLARRADLFAERARQGMIVEAHGDLRPEHVCLTDPPVIIDCLEFNRDLRIQDRLDELAFLAMECEKSGALRAGDIVLQTYHKVSGDRPEPLLVNFYKSYRACIRARLCAWRLLDATGNRSALWRQRTERYLELAHQYAEHFLY